MCVDRERASLLVAATRNASLRWSPDCFNSTLDTFGTSAHDGDMETTTTTEPEPQPREAMTPPNTCADCGLSFYYAPKFHECSTDSRTIAERIEDDKHATTWVDECMTKVGAKR